MQSVELPKDWKWERLGNVIDLQAGIAFKKSEYSKDGVRLFQIANVSFNYIKWDEIEYLPNDYLNTFSNLSLKSGDIVMALNRPLLNDQLKVAEIKKSDTPSILYQRVGRFKFIDKDIHRYFLYFLQSPFFIKWLKEQLQGVNIPFINKSKLLNFDKYPKCSIENQQAIVSKIEELFSELDKGIEQLKTAQQQLKIYRQAVLKWAFEGKLTNENVKDEELPEGWNLTKLGEYIEDISSGKSYRCDERPPTKDEVGIVKVSAVTWGFFDEMESKTCFSKDSFNEKYLIKKNDFLFSRANTIELIGACVLVGTITKTLMLSDKILRFTFSVDVSKEYVLYYLRSRKGRKQIEMLSTGNQDSMRNIGQEKIKQIEFPYCLIEEQNKIVQEIESRLSVADKMEENITQSLQQAEALRQSILKKAFEGKLVS